MKCAICMQKPGAIVYEDSLCYATMPSDAAVAGHMLVIPKQHIESLEEVSEEVMIQLMYVASYAASAAYEKLGCQGTNIFCNNGEPCAHNHLVINILPRKENDGLNFQWTPKQLTPEDFDEIVRKITDKTDFIGAKKEEAPQEVIPETVEQVSVETPEEKEKPQEIPKEEENYQIKHLYRIP